MESWIAAGLLGVAFVLASGTGAEEPLSGTAAQPVELDRLLELPDFLEYGVDRFGGATRGEWRTRFHTARADVAATHAALERAKRELEAVAVGKDSQWVFNAPIGGNTAATDSPLDFQLRQEIRRLRIDGELAERRLRELEVEANLAGVPEAWRE